MKYNTPNFLTALDLDEVTKEGFSHLYCEDGESISYIYIVERISQLPRESRLSISIRKLWQDSVDLECTELSTVLCARS
jgi:hypothetical protein